MERRRKFVQRFGWEGTVVGQREEPIQGEQNSYFTMELAEYLLTQRGQSRDGDDYIVGRVVDGDDCLGLLLVIQYTVPESRD